MRLVIVRHGKAQADSPTGYDFDRDLKGRGERQAAYLADRLASLEPRIARVLASRAVRAHRTAEALASGLGVELSHDDRLLVDEPVSGVLELLADHRDAASMVIVGHNPQLESLVAVLTGRPLSVTGPLRTGEAVVLEVDPAEPLESGAELDRHRLDESNV